MSLAIRVGATTSGRAASFLEVRGLSKSYGATQALRDVSLTIRRGEIHALLGSNGAGKSTLVKIVLGAMRPSGGQILIDGEPVAFRSVKDALAVGIYPIYQHLSQFPHLTVRENMAAFELGTCRNFFLRSALPDDAHIRKHLASVGLDCSLDERVASLSVGQRQLLEIARSLAQNARILVLDEPTAALTRTEAATLLSTLAELRRRGVGILYISHKLEEIVELADRVSVIRDGICSLEGRPMAELSTRDLVTAIVGREVAALSDVSRPENRVVIEVEGLRTRSDGRAVTFSVRAGEVVALAGIVGCGADRIAACISGDGVPLSGEVRVEGHALALGDRAAAVKLGVGYVPPDRQTEGLFDVLDAVANTSASSLPSFLAGGAIHRGRERAHAQRLLDQMELRPRDLSLDASSFSGGNQQKLVIARNLGIADLRLLVLSEPTRGVDIGARQAIHEAVLRIAASGVAVLLATSDIDELLALAHRILIVQRHSVTGTFERGVTRVEVVNALAETAA